MKQKMYNPPLPTDVANEARSVLHKLTSGENTQADLRLSKSHTMPYHFESRFEGEHKHWIGHTTVLNNRVVMQLHPAYEDNVTTNVTHHVFINNKGAWK